MSAVSQFAGDTLLHQSGGFEPQRKSNFALVINGVDDGGGTLVLSLESTSVPGINIVQGNIKYFNETMRYAGSVQPFEDQTIHYRDYLDRATLNILTAWMKRVWNPDTGGIGWAADYKKSADIYLLPPSLPAGGGNTTPVDSSPYNNRVWHLEGVWPKTLKNGGDLDHKDDGASPNLIDLTLSVDRCYPKGMASA